MRPPNEDTNDLPDDEDEAEEEDSFLLGEATADAGFDEPDLGPDERDRDLMDGTWERRHYAGEHRQRDWNTVYLGLSLLVLLGLVIPSLMVLL